ncbi:MAG: sigma-70 family RNA polymerase sigma factor [Dehalococcoidales bacterium]|nr:MAG: sigma-70 family RNA polymerase sigma factor [Dehalococcoidales bacterium]
MQDEQSLVRQAQQGDKDAFAELYEAYFDKIYRYVVLKISNRAEAEDMTQQVFLKAYQSIGSFKWKGVPFSAWLFRIAHNQMVDFVRKQSKRPTVRLEESIVSSDDNPLRTVENRFDIERLRVATRQLTATQQEVISLRFAGGLAIAEVARTMGKSEGAVKALQHSAVAALRKVLLVGEESEKG